MRIKDLLNKESILLGGAPKSKSEAIDMLVELQAKTKKQALFTMNCLPWKIL